MNFLYNLMMMLHRWGYCHWQDGPHFADHRGSRDYTAFLGQECSICSARRKVWTRTCGRIPTPFHTDIHKRANKWVNNV